MIEDSFKGSTIKHSSKTALSGIKIRIPKNKQFIQDMEPWFQAVEKLQNEIKVAEELYKSFIQELSREAIPSVMSPPKVEEKAEVAETKVEVKKEKIKLKIIQKKKVVEE